MTGRTKPPPLMAAPTVKDFGPGQLNAFMRYAESIDEGTIMTAIQSADDLLLDDTGKRKFDGYRYTHLALSQVCSITAYGLMRLLLDLTGEVRRVDMYDEVISVPTAARIFNACVKLRFMRKDGLYGKQLVNNTTERVIDGLVGPLYKYLPHHYLCEIANDIASTQAGNLRFHRAQLVGRRLSMSFLHDATFVGGGHDYSYGIYIVNSEAGECSVQAAVMLARRDADYWCIGKLRRLPHVGKKFSQNLTRLLMRVTGEVTDYLTYEDCFKVLAQKEYDLSSPTGKAAWAKKLVRLGLDKPLAETIVDWAAQVGSGPKATPKRLNKEAAAKRTGIDLFNVMITEAKNYAPKIKELIEHIAFRLLTGQI